MPRSREKSQVAAGAARALLVLASVLEWAVGCDRRPTDDAAPPAPPSSATPRASRPLVAPLRLAHARAFDLVALADGALLVSVGAGAPGAMHAQRLNRHGQAVGAPLEVVRGSEPILELTAVARGARVHVVWAAGGAAGVAARSATGDLEARSFAAPVELGATVTDGGAGTRFALSASDDPNEDGATLLHRTLGGDCGATTSCASFSFATVGAGRHERRGFPLTVPEPCALPLGGYVSIGRRSYYGLCSRAGGTAKSTLFALQPEPMYAGAEPTLAGCTPLGALRLGKAAGFVAQCGPERALARAEIVDRPPSVVPLEPTTRCAGGSPVIDSTSGAGFHWPLVAPQDRLELLLPRAQASASARAVWTGSAVLVAEPTALDLRLRRLECRGERLAPTELE